MVEEFRGQWDPYW